MPDLGRSAIWNFSSHLTPLISLFFLPNMFLFFGRYYVTFTISLNHLYFAVIIYTHIYGIISMCKPWYFIYTSPLDNLSNSLWILTHTPMKLTWLVSIMFTLWCVLKCGEDDKLQETNKQSLTTPTWNILFTTAHQYLDKHSPVQSKGEEQPYIKSGEIVGKWIENKHT